VGSRRRRYRSFIGEESSSSERLRREISTERYSHHWHKLGREGELSSKGASRAVGNLRATAPRLRRKIDPCWLTVGCSSIGDDRQKLRCV
jgi:hypothetical protein